MTFQKHVLFIVIGLLTLSGVYGRSAQKKNNFETHKKSANLLVDGFIRRHESEPKNFIPDVTKEIIKSMYMYPYTRTLTIGETVLCGVKDDGTAEVVSKSMPSPIGAEVVVSECEIFITRTRRKGIEKFFWIVTVGGIKKKFRSKPMHLHFETTNARLRRFYGINEYAVINDHMICGAKEAGTETAVLGHLVCENGTHVRVTKCEAKVFGMQQKYEISLETPFGTTETLPLVDILSRNNKKPGSAVDDAVKKICDDVRNYYHSPLMIDSWFRELTDGEFDHPGLKDMVLQYMQQMKRKIDQ
eukprot:49903_1